MINGSCLCGGVRYTYDGDLPELSLCHCRQCQKAQGSAFAAVCPVDADRLTFVSGRELLKEYRATPGKARVFCANCGSPIYSARDSAPQLLRLRAGTIDTPFQCRSAYHKYVASKATWDVIGDDWPQYPGASK
ncbi:MAG: GFA family protein [Ottowia sp.]|nr:GFA family protein [Ottowia sp.]